jgi:hypothetical protein
LEPCHDVLRRSVVWFQIGDFVVAELKKFVVIVNGILDGILQAEGGGHIYDVGRFASRGAGVVSEA